MHIDENSKIIELQGLIRQIRTEKHNLEYVNSRIAFMNPDNIEKLLRKKRQIEQNIMKLTAKKDLLNNELVDKEQLFETIRMKYAILLLQNMGSSQTDCSKAFENNIL